MPYKQIRENGRCGPLNNSLTVGELLASLTAAVKEDPSILNKAVLLSDDEEGNCYHGCYYHPLVKPDDVKSVLESSNWGKVAGDDHEHAVIIG